MTQNIRPLDPLLPHCPMKKIGTYFLTSKHQSFSTVYLSYQLVNSFYQGLLVESKFVNCVDKDKTQTQNKDKIKIQDFVITNLQRDEGKIRS